MKNKYISWIVVVLWCALIFLVSAQPRLPGPDDQVARFLVMKAGHIFVYAVLYFLVYQAFGVKAPNRALKSILFCVAYGISDEIHQSFVPGRTAMLRDVGIDIIGIGVSAILWRNERKILHSSRTN